MHFTSHSPHVACHVITLSYLCDYDRDVWHDYSVTDVIPLWLCDHDVTPFPHFTFIVVI